MSHQKHQVFLNLVAAEVGQALIEKAKPESTLPEKIMIAFASAKHHFMVTDPDIQMMGALCAVYEVITPEEQITLKENIDSLKQLNDLITASQTGRVFDPEVIKTPKTPIMLMRLWHEAP